MKGPRYTNAQILAMCHAPWQWQVSPTHMPRGSCIATSSPTTSSSSGTRSGEIARIADFGLAISTGPDDTRLTTTGMTMGTPAYVAPEQAPSAKP